jgi:hypothetical protein
MKAFYDDYSIEELRIILLNGELEHKLLTEEDYSDLIDNEMSLSNPLNDVIDFCISGLSKHESYQELDKINIDIKAIIKASDKENVNRKIRIRKVLLKIAAAVLVIIILPQTISLAFGFNLWRHVFNWDKEIMHIENPHIDTIDEEPKFIIYEGIEDIPQDFKFYIPFYVWDNFDFINATNLIYGDIYLLSFYFNKINIENINLSIVINNQINMSIEKDESFFEEYVKDGIEYSVFKNLEYFKVLWIEGDLLYHVNINLPLEEVKDIIDKF